MDGKAVCNACAALLLQPLSALVLIGGSAMVLAALALTAHAAPVPPLIGWIGASLVGLSTIIAAWRLTAASNQRRAMRKLALRPISAPGTVVGHPYRGAARRIGRRVAPPLSGRMAAFVVGSVLFATVGLVPSLLRKSPLIEAIVVVAIWWLVLSLTLTALLYKGWRIARDD